MNEHFLKCDGKDIKNNLINLSQLVLRLRMFVILGAGIVVMVSFTKVIIPIIRLSLYFIIKEIFLPIADLSL